jgi:hypothetical protein
LLKLISCEIGFINAFCLSVTVQCLFSPERFILPYLPSIDKCKELVGKAKKGTLVYTDISLASKFDDAPKVNLNGENDTDKDDILPCDNIVTAKHRGNNQDYIFGRLKRDAELGDSKAQEVSQKVRDGKYCLLSIQSRIINFVVVRSSLLLVRSSFSISRLMLAFIVFSNTFMPKRRINNSSWDNSLYGCLIVFYLDKFFRSV